MPPTIDDLTGTNEEDFTNQYREKRDNLLNGKQDFLIEPNPSERVDKEAIKEAKDAKQKAVKTGQIINK